MVEIRCGQDENVHRKEMSAGVIINIFFFLLKVPLSGALLE